MENKIQKKEILGGEIRKVHVKTDTGKDVVEFEPSPDYSPEKIKEDLSKYGLQAVENVEVVNPVTGVKSIVTIDRTGTHEGKLAIAMTDKSLSREQKDSVLSMYLWERGKESASMLVDLMRYKGAHTKETRAFMSQTRFDFEMFVKLFIEQMRAVARDIAKEYNIEKISDYCKDYFEAVGGFKECDYCASKAGSPILCSDCLDRRTKIDKVDTKDLWLKTMVRNWTEADRFEESVKKVTENRERQKGFGIYIDAQGKPYSIFEDEKVDDVVKRDIERLKDLEKNQDE